MPICSSGRPTDGFSASTSSRSTCPPAGVRRSPPARWPSCLPTARPTASGPTTSWCWRTRAARPLKELAREYPDLLKQEDPTCELVSCTIIPSTREERSSRDGRPDSPRPVLDDRDRAPGSAATGSTTRSSTPWSRNASTVWSSPCGRALIASRSFPGRRREGQGSRSEPAEVHYRFPPDSSL